MSNEIKQVVTINNLTKSFRHDFYKNSFKALDDISFSITRGRVTGFLGANGAGKTTLIKILLDLIKADFGSILWDSDLKSGHGVLKNVGYLPERPYFYQDLTGRQFCSYIYKLTTGKNIISKSVWNLADELKIEHALDRKIRNYSKGMMQRLGLLSILSHNPQLIILDEPLSGLDPIGRIEFKEIFKKLKASGVTLFFSSHIVSDVSEVCDEVVVLDGGRLKYAGATESLLKRELEYHKVLIRVTADEVQEKQFKSNEELSQFLKELDQPENLLEIIPHYASLEKAIYGGKK